MANEIMEATIPGTAPVVAAQREEEKTPGEDAPTQESAVVAETSEIPAATGTEPVQVAEAATSASVEDGQVCDPEPGQRLSDVVCVKAAVCAAADQVAEQPRKPAAEGLSKSRPHFPRITFGTKSG